MMLLRACPRCGGDLHETMDIYGPFHQCIQCGHIQELPAGQIDTPDERAVAKAKDVNGVAA